MGLLGRALGKLMTWAVAKNGGGGYTGEDDSRWAYTIKGVDGSDYLSRILLPRVRIPFLNIEFRPMIHQFHRHDADDELHDHPWLWAGSLVLSGAYDEERLVGDPRRDRYMTADGVCGLCKLWRGSCAGHDADVDQKHVTRFNVLRGDDYHKVTRLHGDVFTLFIAGDRKKDDEWGFLDAQGYHVPHAEFLAERRRQYLESQQRKELTKLVSTGKVYLGDLE